MEAGPINQAPGAFTCSCGRNLQTGTVYCDACGQAVAYTDVTVRLPAPPATGMTTRLHSPVFFSDMSEDIAQMLAALRKGMQVFTFDGVRLGKITELWAGQDPTEQDARWDEAVCSRLEVHRGLWGQNVLYIPYPAIAAVMGRRVTLIADAATVDEQPWDQRPRWFAHPRRRQLIPGGDMPPV